MTFLSVMADIKDMNWDYNVEGDIVVLLICNWRVLKKSLSTLFVPQSWENIEAGGYPQTPTRRFPGPLFRQFNLAGFGPTVSTIERGLPPAHKLSRKIGGQGVKNYSQDRDLRSEPLCPI